ncbi:nucleotidyltransferase/DNA polymerase involved in DNA repair [Thioflavicoccus mobilis 8321]|uniref:DNA polymerase IV n=2 Tax=Thioflavicoccus mobilis TaxID=80679 RepID=L0H0E2_9GAMM|nr:nucleotidyltransferase/DNA polymerase involved in DNA repair [Thioflavicoccus mobilis 8321]
MHVDLDAFYAAIEQRDHPPWRGLPVVVGAAPGTRGVVATCSYEARRYGVRSAMPIAEAVRRLPPETVYLRPRMGDYAAVSRQVMAALGDISPVVEKVSIDEAFLDLSGLAGLIGPPAAIGALTKAAIRAAVGLSASVGIGPNRLIAKLASEHRKPDGLTVVHPEQVQTFLDPLPFRVLRGVGAKTSARLDGAGVKTVADVRRLPLVELRRLLGARVGAEVHLQARGIADDRVDPARERKSISKETTFPEDVADVAVLRDAVLWAAQEVGFLARQEGRAGVVVTLKIRLRPFETHTRSRTLAVPTASDGEIFRAAWSLFDVHRWAGRSVRLIGVGLSGWAGRQGSQPDLLDAAVEPTSPRSRRLDETLDAVRRRFGDGALQRGLRPRR